MYFMYCYCCHVVVLLLLCWHRAWCCHVKQKDSMFRLEDTLQWLVHQWCTTRVYFPLENWQTGFNLSGISESCCQSSAEQTKSFKLPRWKFHTSLNQVSTLWLPMASLDLLSSLINLNKKRCSSMIASKPDPDTRKTCTELFGLCLDWSLQVLQSMLWLKRGVFVGHSWAVMPKTNLFLMMFSTKNVDQWPLEEPQNLGGVCIRKRISSRC